MKRLGIMVALGVALVVGSADLAVAWDDGCGTPNYYERQRIEEANRQHKESLEVQKDMQGAMEVQKDMQRAMEEQKLEMLMERMDRNHMEYERELKEYDRKMQKRFSESLFD
jgi:hypothetical protein